MAVHMCLSRPLSTLLLCLLTGTAALASTADSHAASATCSGARSSIAKVSPRAIGGAVLCLVNAERRARGLAPLRDAGPLRTAAQRFSADMVARGYFDHVSPYGSTVSSRVRGAGYRNMSSVGENIGWGSGAMATPAAIVRAWMASPPHRAVILNGHFREAGVGVTAGAPVAGRTGATFVLDVGSR